MKIDAYQDIEVFIVAVVKGAPINRTVYSSRRVTIPAQSISNSWAQTSSITKKLYHDKLLSLLITKAQDVELAAATKRINAL